VANLLDAIEASKERPLWRLLTALGIRGVGAVVAQLLTSHFTSLKELMEASEEELEAIKGLGPHIAESILDFFAQERNRHLIEKLRQAGVRMTRLPEEAAPEEGPLSGLTFVITGTLPTMSREAASELIAAHGGHVTSSVSRNTSYLLAGEAPGGTKLSRAQELGVPTIDEQELRRLVEAT
jgi:DNA ligase (NAD+)